MGKILMQNIKILTTQYYKNLLNYLQNGVNIRKNKWNGRQGYD